MEEKTTQELLDTIKNQVNAQLEAFKGEVNNPQLQENLETLKNSITTLESKIDAVKDEQANENLRKSLTNLESIVKLQGTEIEKAKWQPTPKHKKVSFSELGKMFAESEAYKSFISKDAKGKSDALTLKEVSLSGNYTGYANAPATLTDETGVVISQPYQTRPLRVRDLMSSSPIDVPFVISEEVVDWVNNIAVTAENGTLTEFDFTVEPTTFQKKRIGAYTKISKDMIQSRDFVVSEVERMLPAKYYYVEDKELISGSGTGEHLLGLFANTKRRSFDIDLTFGAGDISSVAAHANGGVLITFAADHKLWEGYSLTIANSVNYNATYTVHVHTKKKIVVDATYVAEATAAWTGTASHPLKDRVDSPNAGDVAAAAAKSLHNGYMRPTGIVMNPFDVFDVAHSKGTDEHYVGRYERGNDGILRIDGIPVIESDVVPVGKIYVGDFANAAKIYDYRNLEMYMDTDVSYNLKNQVALIIEAHVILANFNPLMFMDVDIATAKAALARP